MRAVPRREFIKTTFAGGVAAASGAGGARSEAEPAARSKSEEVKIRAVKDNGGATRYEFVAGSLSGEIVSDQHHHGIVRLVHQASGKNIVQQGMCFLNAEYYLSPNSPKHVAEWGPDGGYIARAIPRRTSQEGLVTSRTEGNKLTLHFPDSLCPEDIKVELDLVYQFHADNKIDLTYHVLPKLDIPKFEVFTASYIIEATGKTCIPYKAAGGRRSWDIFGEDQSVARGGQRTFNFVRDDAAGDILTDGRHPLTDFSSWKRHYYDLPVIVVMSDDGYVVAFFVEPKWCSVLTGQHHGQDTARDWSLLTDLKQGRPWVARTRTIYDRLGGTPEEKFEHIERLYQQFLTDLREER